MLGGPAFLQALQAPYPMMRFVPTGGVTPASLPEYLALDCVAAVGGTWLARGPAIASGAWDEVERLAREAAAIVAAGPRRSDRGHGVAMALAIKGAEETRWDLVALGEVMLRLDPGEDRIHTARQFRAWEGGGEYNVARGLRRCFGLRTAIVTALADNPIGRLVEDMMLAGGVDLRHVSWVPYDGVGRTVRNGLNFTERGFGVRGAVGVSDRGHTAVSQLRPGDVDWDAIFGTEGARWFHTGGIFAALSPSTAEVAAEAMAAARRHGTIVSYDLNYRPSLWKGIGGKEQAQAVNRSLAPLVDVMLGNEEDFSAALGFAPAGRRPGPGRAGPRAATAR